MTNVRHLHNEIFDKVDVLVIYSFSRAVQYISCRRVVWFTGRWLDIKMHYPANTHLSNTVYKPPFYVVKQLSLENPKNKVYKRFLKVAQQL